MFTAHAAAAIVVAARSSRVNIDSPLGTAVHTKARPGDAAANDNKQQLLTEQETSKKLGIDSG